VQGVNLSTISSVDMDLSFSHLPHQLDVQSLFIYTASSVDMQMQGISLSAISNLAERGVIQPL
jgi:hypothetical protein